MESALSLVWYTSGDGTTRIPGWLVKPGNDRQLPGVLVLRGVAGPDDGYTEIAQRLASWGYCALVHGWKIRGDDPTDSVVVADVAGALKFFRSHPDVDAHRLAVFGFCRGGVHAMIAATAHAGFRCVVVFHGFAFRPEEARRGIEPYDLAQRITVPTLILHGTDDERAPVAGMRRVEQAVRALARPIDFKYYDGARHGFAVRTHPGFNRRTAEESFAEARRFIDALLK